jgi:hypothetical protein
MKAPRIVVVTGASAGVGRVGLESARREVEQPGRPIPRARAC